MGAVSHSPTDEVEEQLELNAPVSMPREFSAAAQASKRRKLSSKTALPVSEANYNDSNGHPAAIVNTGSTRTNEWWLTHASKVLEGLADPERPERQVDRFWLFRFPSLPQKYSGASATALNQAAELVAKKVQFLSAPIRSLWDLLVPVGYEDQLARPSSSIFP